MEISEMRSLKPEDYVAGISNYRLHSYPCQSGTYSTILPLQAHITYLAVKNVLT